MVVINDKKDCCGCSSCKQICTKKAIKMIEDKDGCLYPYVDENKCINCGLCERVCPIKQSKIKKYENKEVPLAYGGWINNKKICVESSSGGIFTALAEVILEAGGIVIGAALSQNMIVEHIIVESIEDISKLRGSKYVQSKIGDLYIKTKNKLIDNKIVYFSGTPCEIEGLYAFLGKKYDLLYTQDIICHGSTSPSLWKKYVEWQEDIHNQKVKNAYFRSKDKGWTKYSMKLIFDNKKYCKDLYHDGFLQLFMSNLYLRPSCYECSFKKINRKSDITLADFWGCGNIYKELDNDEGVSLIIVHTQKGKKLLELCNKRIKIMQVDFNNSIKYNDAITKSAQLLGNREEFEKDLKILNISQLQKKYVKKQTFKARLIHLLPTWLIDIVKIKKNFN